MPPFGTEDILDKDLWDEVLVDFEKENNVNVEVEIIPWKSYEEKYLTGITSGTGPDVGYMYMEMISDFIDMDALMPLDPYFTSIEKEKFYYLDKGVINGKQYSIPIVVGNPRVLLYNKAILKDSGINTVPTTWEDFIDVCQRIKTDTDGDGKADRYAFLLPFAHPSISALNVLFYPFLWQAGGDLFNDAGTEVLFDSDAGLEAAKFLYDLRFTYNILPDISTSLNIENIREYFKDGKVAFIIDETNTVSQMDYAGAGIDWGFRTSLSEKRGGTFVAADSLVLLSGSAHKELAAALIKYMVSAPSMKRFHEMSPFPPIASDEAYSDQDAFRKIYEEDQDSLFTLKPVKGSYKIYDYLYKNLQLMLVGKVSPEEALSTAAEYAENTLERR